MPRVKTNEEFARDALEKNEHVIVTGIYVNSDTEISVKCKYCGLEYHMRPKRILMGRGHQQCLSAIKNKERTKTNDEFLEYLFEINPYVNPLEDYISSGEKIKCECVVCGHIWNVTPNKLLIGRGCPKCRSKKIGDMCRWDNNKFLSELSKKEVNVTPLETYVTSDTPIKCRCNICGCIWHPRPSSLLHGFGCPTCKASKGERKIAKFLLTHNISFERNKTFDGLLGIKNGHLSYDFYIESMNLLIEYQGQFHDGTITSNFQSKESFAKQQEHDKRKKLYAITHDIELIEIWYWDFDNIENILSSKLKIKGENVNE